MNNLDIYINFIIFIKICFIISAITHGYLKRSDKAGSYLDEKPLYWKEKLEFIFNEIVMEKGVIRNLDRQAIPGYIEAAKNFLQNKK